MGEEDRPFGRNQVDHDEFRLDFFGKLPTSSKEETPREILATEPSVQVTITESELGILKMVA